METMKPSITETAFVIGLLLITCVHHHQCSSQQILLPAVDEGENENEEQPIVFLTVSSLASPPSIKDRLLELNWHNVLNGSDGNVRLYNHDPNESSINDYLVSIELHEYSKEQYYRTEVQFPRYTFTSNNITDDCLGFWIALVKNNNVLTSSCIKTFPNWMYEMRSVIGNASLLQLMIPGSHDAGSHAYFDPSDDTIFKRYLFTQEENVLNQLVYGIRYLDLRVSYGRVTGASDRFWITHGVFRTDIPLSSVINDVKSFLSVTKEIVIMDFHRFVNGFAGRRSSSRHRSLIELLERELSDFMIPVSMSSTATLEELWHSGKTLYVGYASNSERTQSQFLFPAVRHLWGDKDDVQELFSYLNANVCRRRQRRLTSAMAQLTPTTSGAIFDVYGGLRKMAHDVNRCLTKWFRDLWWHCSNIISTDFFLGNNIIRTAIETNKKRFSSTVLRDEGSK